ILLGWPAGRVKVFSAPLKAWRASDVLQLARSGRVGPHDECQVASRWPSIGAPQRFVALLDLGHVPCNESLALALPVVGNLRGRAGPFVHRQEAAGTASDFGDAALFCEGLVASNRGKREEFVIHRDLSSTPGTSHAGGSSPGAHAGSHGHVAARKASSRKGLAVGAPRSSSCHAFAAVPCTRRSPPWTGAMSRHISSMTR